MVGLSINNRRKTAAVVTLGRDRVVGQSEFRPLRVGLRSLPSFFYPAVYTKEWTKSKKPGSIDVLSTRIEGDPYLAAHSLSHEGKSAAE
jgi:hypothetical protein